MRRASCVLIGTLIVGANFPVSAKPDVRIDMGTYLLPERGKVSIFIHFGSVSRHETWMTAQQERWFTDPQPTGAGAAYRSELDTDAYDCDAKRVAAVTHVLYAGERLSGSVVESVEHPIPADYQWSTPAPGSALESILQMVCKIGALKQGNMLPPALPQ